MSSRQRELACAKVNLNLAITGRDAAGYHRLETVMGFARGAHDVLTLDVAGEGPDRLVVTGPLAGRLVGDDDNLVVQASDAVRAERPDLPPLHWTLEKHLPIAAGIGGGSADAGAALRLMERVFAIDPDILANIAPTLGADVPIAYRDEAAWATGRGDVLADIALAEVPAVLVNPGVASETPIVFRAYRNSGATFSERRPAPNLSAIADIYRWCSTTGNDLLAAAVTVAPAVEDVLGAIGSTSACRYAGMSGSGATCFGLFDNASDANAAATALSDAHSTWWVRAVTIG